MLEPGAVIGDKYVLERPAGFGGMAQLWVARNQATGAEVCVKILVREGEGEDAHESVERFRREAHAVAKLSHRAIVGVFDLIELDAAGNDARGGLPHGYAMVMELLRGESLGDRLAKRGQLPLDEALDLFLPVMSALAHAHRAEVVHRDLKPDNIFLATDPDGHVTPKVLDFGVSKLSRAESLTTDGVIVGTPGFMSPEQASGARDIDARSDVFSAGLLFYVVLTGSNPFDGDAFDSVVDAIARREVPPIPELPPAIWAVLERALEKDPALRFADATEMGIELRKASGRKSSTESHPIPPLVPLLPSTPTFAEGAATAAPARGGPASQRPVRAIAAAVVGASGALLVAALVVMYARRDAAPPEPVLPTAAITTAAEAEPAAATPPPIATEKSAKAEAIEPAALDAAAPSTTPEPAPSEATSEAPERSATPPAAGTSASAPRRLPPPRKPGEEPEMARDPGF